MLSKVLKSASAWSVWLFAPRAGAWVLCCFSSCPVGEKCVIIVTSLTGCYEEGAMARHQWASQDAKAHFSELLRNSAKEPQVVSVRGVPTAVVVSIDEYLALTTPATTLVDFFRKSPLVGLSLKMSRDKSPCREIDL